MEKARSDTVTVVQAKINWGKLDKTKFYGRATSIGLTVGLHPLSVVKTRMQVATKHTVDKSAYSGLRGLLRTEGIPGLYRGFGTAMTGEILARIVFFSALDTTKVAAFKMVEPFKLSDHTKAAIANGTAVTTAFLCSQGVSVPIHVLSKRLMVQGYSGHESYNGALDVARKVVKQDGIRGLYRGFGLSVMTPPSTAIWLVSHGYSQRVIWSLLGYQPDSNKIITSILWKIILVQGAGGIFAGAVESCIMTPLDTIKTRLQVMGHGKRPSIRQVIKTLIADDGWKGFFRGIGPRFFCMSAWGTSMLLAYYHSEDRRVQGKPRALPRSEAALASSSKGKEEV